jgi:hypothetical protein
MWSPGPAAVPREPTPLKRAGTARQATKEFHADQPSIRVLPVDLLSAAGLPIQATADRTLAYTLEVRRAGQVLARVSRSLTVGPTDGTYAEASAPVAPAVAKVGAPVTVHYDLTGVRRLNHPQLAVSTVGHWSPAAAPLFTAGYTVDLTATAGTVTLPASAFHGGTGLYTASASSSRALSRRSTGSSPPSASSARWPPGRTRRPCRPADPSGTRSRSAGPRPTSACVTTPVTCRARPGRYWRSPRRHRRCGVR